MPSTEPFSSWSRWLLPDAALFVSLVTLFYCLFAYSGTRQLFRDADSGWHIITGESLLDGRPLPRTDPYSFSQPGKAWFAWEWGADVLMGLAHRWDGLRGVALLYAAVIAACSWAWFRLHWLLGTNFFLACLLASPLLSTANLHWLARPHVFSWLLMLAALGMLERARARFGLRQAVLWLLLGALWANLHASFLFPCAAAALYGTADLASSWLWGGPPRRARWYFSAAACSLAGTFLNPYGWRLHGHVAAYLGNRELLQRIGEFQSFNFHVEGAAQILAAILIAVAGGIAAFAHRRLDHCLLCLCLVAMALRSARGLPLVALLALPPAGAALTRALEGLELRPRLTLALRRALAYSERLRALDARAAGWLYVPVALALAWVLLHAPPVTATTGFPPDQFPVAAAAAVAQLPPDARLLAPDKFGGYLIYRFRGARKVYFDGRSDFYGIVFMKEYIRLTEMRPGWQEILESHGFTHALLPVEWGLAGVLEMMGWKRLYHDKTAILLEKR